MRLFEKQYFLLVLIITTSAELEYSATPLRNQDVPRSSFCLLPKKKQLIDADVQSRNDENDTTLVPNPYKQNRQLGRNYFCEERIQRLFIVKCVHLVQRSS